MTQLKYLARMTVLVGALIVGIHLAWSAIVSTAISYYYQPRIFDIHRLGGTAEQRWVSAYIKTEVTDDQVVAAGSSFTFLYPFDASYSYTAELNRRGIWTANVSATGYGVQAIHDAILCSLIQHNKRPRALVLEISLINEIAHLRAAGENGLLADCPKIDNSGLFLFALMHPRGVDWLTIARDQFYMVTPPEKPSLGEVPDSYFPTATDFARAKPYLEANIKNLYRRAKSITDNVTMFVTPVYYDGISVIGRDADVVRAQFEATLEICKQTAQSDCLDTSNLIAEGNFANMTHFNANGSKALALAEITTLRRWARSAE